MSKRRIKKRDYHKGIYLLPNLATTLNLFCGFYAVIASLEGHFWRAAAAVIVAGLFDNLDGRIARATRSTSRFGVEYDSLADLVSFGMAPALLAYLWALSPYGRLGWLGAFLFVACGALRLARFNTHAGQGPSTHFTGLPIPAAAGMVAATVLFCGRMGLSGSIPPLFVLVMLYALSFLMVSSIPYPSFKKKMGTKGFNTLVVTLLVLIFVAAEPEITLFMVGVTYIAYGILSAALGRLKHRGREEAADQAAPLEESTTETPT
ncbi:MAG: CDP-diacylglycerol--serine O-phosphatidyltransferase [Deltaproteobacteria bacterium]|nr:CDP-diacylglycerol--serine O-phosphatidyltransferase [Deltaproteobacteria bacterium]